MKLFITPREAKTIQAKDAHEMMGILLDLQMNKWRKAFKGVPTKREGNTINQYLTEKQFNDFAKTIGFKMEVPYGKA